MFYPLKNGFTSTMKADVVLTAALEQIRTQGKLYLLHDPASGSIDFVSAGKQWRNCCRGNYL